jgi:hypothetical protein
MNDKPQLSKFRETVPAKGRKFLVKFKDCPDLELEAEDRHEAWEKYRKHCGILDTIHKPEISVVGSE